MYDIIIDCYTDEPSGLGVPPYLSIHSRYLAGSLTKLNRKYYYLTIDDLRYANGEELDLPFSFNKRVLNTTKNKDDVVELIRNSSNLYIVMGCFVKYNYISAEPATFEELKALLNIFHKKAILFYSLGSDNMLQSKVLSYIPKELFSDVYFGNSYNYFFAQKDNYKPNYHLLADISVMSSSILEHISRPLIMEIETAVGCDRKPGCTFCIENMRNIPVEYRKTKNIVNEIKSLYNKGSYFFRLGRQPNFYSYMNCHPYKIKKLLKSILKECPNIKTLHIDNTSPHSIATKKGQKITKIISKYCTSGNIGPIGVESFDENVRQQCNLNGTISDIHRSIEILNKYGAHKGNDGMPIFLPGLNIIYGLPGQTSSTLQNNLENLQQILSKDLYVRRVFVRKLTSPFGEQFDDSDIDYNIEFDEWKKTICNEFSIPMLEKIYPINHKLYELRMEMYEDGNSILRKMGTCPVRILVKNKKLELDKFYNVKIVNHITDRTLEGIII